MLKNHNGEVFDGDVWAQIKEVVFKNILARARRVRDQQQQHRRASPPSEGANCQTDCAAEARRFPPAGSCK